MNRVRKNNPESRFLRRLYWASFWIRFVAGTTAWIVTVVFEIGFMQDALAYERWGAEVAQDWRNGNSSIWMETAMESGITAWFMVYVIAVFYFFTGGLRLLPLLLGFYCLITAWSPVISYRIVRTMGGSPRAARITGYFIALSPSFAFWAGSLYKEGMVLLAMNLILYHTIRLQHAWRLQSFAIICAAMPLLFGLRFYLAFMMSLVVGLGMLLGRTRLGREGGSDVAIRQLGVVLLFIGAMVGVGFTDRVQEFLPEDLESGLARIQSSRDDLSSYQSGYLEGVDVSTPGKAIQFLPVGMFYFLTVPWPWDFGSLRQNLAIPETTVWSFLYPVVAVGIAEAWRRNRQGTLVLLATIIGLTAFYGLFSSNIGVAYRMRTQVWLPMAVFVGLGLERLFMSRGGRQRRKMSFQKIQRNRWNRGPVIARNETVPI